MVTAKVQESVVNTEDATKMSLFFPRLCIAPATVADSFDSSMASPVLAKVENKANTSLPERNA